MELLDNLSRRVQQAAQEIVELKKERSQLLSELELLRGQLAKHREVLRENEAFHRDRDRLKNRLERLDRKLGKLVAGDALYADTPEVAP